MHKDLEIHYVQSSILRHLLWHPFARFSELNILNLTTDHFNFHLKQVVKDKLVEKTQDGKYKLSVKGKEFANRIDSPDLVLSKERKIVALIGCIKKEGRKTTYLFQKRLKQPFYGMHDFISGRVGWGASIFDSAREILKRETGLFADLSLVGIEHKKDLLEGGVLIEDKFMFIFRGDNVSGSLKKDFKGGQNFWLTRKQINNLDNVFKNIPMFIDMLHKKELVFVENSYINKIY